MTRAILTEDEFDRVTIQVFHSGVEAAAFIVAVTRSPTWSASRFESVGVAVAYLSSIVCSKGYMCGSDSGTA